MSLTADWGTFPDTFPGYIDGLQPAPGSAPGPGGSGGAPSPSPEAGWELQVRSYADYSRLLAVIPGRMITAMQFAKQLNDLGSGNISLNMDDPWWASTVLADGSTTDTLLDFECLWQFWQDGVCRFEFLGETIAEQLVDSSEQRIVTVTGPGTIAVLKWAMAAPQGFPHIVLKTDAIADTFDEVNDAGVSVLDTNIWNLASPLADIFITPITPIYNNPGGAKYAVSTLYPSGTLTIQATPGTTFLGASPYDATDSLISAQITPVGSQGDATDSNGNSVTYGTGLNGSELTQMYVQSLQNGSYYALFGLSGSEFYCQLAGPSGTFTHIIAAASAYSPDNHAYWMITEQAGSGGGSGTFYFWTSPDGQSWTQQWNIVHNWDATACGVYFAAAYSTTGQSAILTNLNSNVSAPSYQGNLYLGEPIMGIWDTLLEIAQGRGTIPFVSYTGTSGGDSFGRPWTDLQNVQVTNGTDLYSMLQSAAAVANADYVMQPGFQLVVGQTEQGSISLGVDRTSTLIFREGRDQVAKSRSRVRDSIVNLIGAENADGHEISSADSASVVSWAQREGWYQTGSQVDPESMAIAAAAAAADNADEVLSWTLSITPDLPGKTVFKNFDVGDWVGLERPDFSAIDSVRVVGIGVQIDSTGLQQVELTMQSYLQWIEQQLTYISNKLGGAFVNALGTTPVAPSVYGAGQVPTYFTPAASLSNLADVVGNGGQHAAALVYNAATGQWQVSGSTDPVSGQALGLTVPGSSGTVAVSGGAVSVSAATSPAIANDGGGSSGSLAVVTTTPNGNTIIDASGTTRVIVGQQSDGTVTVKEVNGSAPAAPDAPSVAGGVLGLIVGWDGLLAGSAPLSDFLYVQVHSSTSPGFTPGSGTLAGTMTTPGLFGIGGLTAGTTYYVKLVAVNKSRVSGTPSSQVSGVPTSVPANIPAGSIAGSQIVTGTITSTQISATAGILGSQLSATAGISAGQVSFTARNIGGITTTVGATMPGSAVANDLWFNSTNGYQLYQFNGTSWQPYQFGTQAIQANSVTAALIAANTITAAQIAGGTITATQIAAATITGTQIAAGTISASLLQAGIVVAGIIDGTVVTGSTVQNSNSNPRTSINPDGSLSISNASGVVVFKIGPDGTQYWFSQAGILQMELTPGGTELIYASSTGPSSWDFEPPGLPGVVGTLTSSTSATAYAIPATNGSIAGNAIVVAASCSGATAASSVTDSQGNSYTLAKSNTTSEELQVFVSVTGNALSGTDTITVHYGSANTQVKTLAALSVSNLNPSTLVDFSGASGGTSASPSVSGTPLNFNDLVLAFVSDASAGGAIGSVPDGWQLLTTVNTSGGTWLNIYYSSNVSGSAMTFSGAITSAAWGAVLLGLLGETPVLASGNSWTGQNAAVAPSTAWSQDGLFSLLVTHSGTSHPWGTTSPDFPVQGGTLASMQVTIFTPASLASVGIGFTFWSGTNGNGTNLGTVAGDQGTVAMTAGEVATFTITGATVPNNAQSATFFVNESAADASGVTFSIDVVQTPGGLVYSNSPVATVDPFGNMVDQGINFIGLPGLTNVFGVEDPYGDQLMSIDSGGNVNAQSFSATADVIVQGSSLMNTLLPELPQGIIARGWATPSSFPWPTPALTATETAILEVDATLQAGRMYRIAALAAGIAASVSTWGRSIIRYTSDGSTPTTASTVLCRTEVTLSGTNTAALPEMENFIAPTTTGLYRFLLTAQCGGGGATFQFQSGNFAPSMVVEDVGLGSSANTTNLGVTLGSGTSGSSGGSTVTQTWYPTATYSYYGSGASNGSNTRRASNSFLWQGNPGGSTGPQVGDQYSFMVWPSSAIVAALSGATINQVTLRLSNGAAHYSTGTFAVLGYAGFGSFQPTGSLSGAHENVTSFEVGEGATLTRDLTNLGFGTALASGAATCFLLGPSSSTSGGSGDLFNYGLFYGMGSTAKMPMLSITYTG